MNNQSISQPRPLSVKPLQKPRKRTPPKHSTNDRRPFVLSRSEFTTNSLNRNLYRIPPHMLPDPHRRIMAPQTPNLHAHRSRINRVPQISMLRHLHEVAPSSRITTQYPSRMIKGATRVLVQTRRSPKPRSRHISLPRSHLRHSFSPHLRPTMRLRIITKPLHGTHLMSQQQQTRQLHEPLTIHDSHKSRNMAQYSVTRSPNTNRNV